MRCETEFVEGVIAALGRIRVSVSKASLESKSPPCVVDESEASPTACGGRVDEPRLQRLSILDAGLRKNGCAAGIETIPNLGSRAVFYMCQMNPEENLHTFSCVCGFFLQSTPTSITDASSPWHLAWLVERTACSHEVWLSHRGFNESRVFVSRPSAGGMFMQTTWTHNMLLLASSKLIIIFDGD